MTPLTVKSRRELRRYERNLGAPATQNTSADTSYILRILWEGWQVERGRAPTHDEVQKLAVPMLNIAKRYLPELQRKSKVKHGSNTARTPNS